MRDYYLTNRQKIEDEVYRGLLSTPEERLAWIDDNRDFLEEAYRNNPPAINPLELEEQLSDITDRLDKTA
jgi:hypothetical protein